MSESECEWCAEYGKVAGLRKELSLAQDRMARMEAVVEAAKSIEQWHPAAYPDLTKALVALSHTPSSVKAAQEPSEAVKKLKTVITFVETLQDSPKSLLFHLTKGLPEMKKAAQEKPR